MDAFKIFIFLDQPKKWALFKNPLQAVPREYTYAHTVDSALEEILRKKEPTVSTEKTTTKLYFLLFLSCANQSTTRLLCCVVVDMQREGKIWSAAVHSVLSRRSEKETAVDTCAFTYYSYAFTP